MPDTNANGAATSTSSIPTHMPNPTPPSSLFLAPIVHAVSPTELEILPRALLCVERGRVAWIERLDTSTSAGELAAAQDAARARGVDPATIVVLEEGFLCPGFVDTHTHAPQYPNNGLGGELQLLDWLKALTFPLEEKFADDKFAERVYTEVVRRNLAAGTTTASYYGTIHVPASLTLARVCREAGQRALIGRCSMDRECPASYVEASADASMAATREFIAAFERDAAGADGGGAATTNGDGAVQTCLTNGTGVNGDAHKACSATDTSSVPPLVSPILTPRFAISCTPALLRSLGALAAATDLPVQTHISENTGELARVAELFPDIDSYAGVYDAFGLLRPGTILAHGVHLSPSEMSLIASRGAGVSHCPGSNTHLSSGAARVVELLDAGVPVGLGSDCSGGPALGVLANIRAASAVARILQFEGKTKRRLTTAELLYMATRGGAALCRANTGDFGVGREFDALWIRPRSPGMWVRDGEGVGDVFEKFIWTGDDRDIAAVWVRGRQVVGDRVGDKVGDRVGDKVGTAKHA